MPHDPALVAEVGSWLSKAGKDLAAAAYELVADPPFADDIAFHAQQAAEKSLKAFLSWHGVPFRKTHNLIELGEACCQIDGSEYAWKFRYPGDPEDATAEEAAGALATAREVFDTVLRCLPPDVVP
jgi:HEPN domain-containing protein